MIYIFGDGSSVKIKAPKRPRIQRVSISCYGGKVQSCHVDNEPVPFTFYRARNQRKKKKP